MNELPVDLRAKHDRLLELLRSFGSCAVALSGGVDSAVLAKAAQLALGDRAVALTGVSAALAVAELDEAKQLAQKIGIRHELIETDELQDPQYQQNTFDRCYFCKTRLYAQLQGLARRLGVPVVVDGSNRDDGREHRPGMRAAREQNVRSPLAECDLGKGELRTLAAFWGIPIWDKPATPCLASRLAYGERVTPERLAMIDKAEQFLREHGLKELRVRYHKDDMARIEVPPEMLPKFLDRAFRQAVVEKLKSAGFRYVCLDLEGFRSGSLNEVLPVHTAIR